MDSVVRDLLSSEREKSGQKMDTENARQPRVKMANLPPITLND